MEVNGRKAKPSNLGPVHTEPFLLGLHVRGWFKIYPDLCGFVLGFVWTPETQTITSSPRPVTL